MILCYTVWRGALRHYKLLPPTLQCVVKLPSHRSAASSLLCLLPTKRRLPGSSQIHVQLLRTDSTLLQVRDQNKHVSVQTRSTEAKPQTAAQKVKQAGRDVTFFVVVIVGVALTVGLIYCTVSELFSSSSPSSIYGKAFTKCKNHPEIIGAFGEPIKGHGEQTTRGRRQHVNSTEYIKDGAKCMRLKFYISGSEQKKEGTVYVDVKQNPQTEKYEFQYIIVEIDTYPRRTIVIEDNRYSN
ncbi:mitochondrial import inner membrane translocase subunit Tim21 [Hyperolius riggenbachi]|uniref:mitochondrial import inner membrane translocase subunit Tim21 n=1 Tax=Hyperolius riggenbachi TaxID=752182 RepID=UPI0035A27B8E